MWDFICLELIEKREVDLVAGITIENVSSARSSTEMSHLEQLIENNMFFQSVLNSRKSGFYILQGLSFVCELCHNLLTICVLVITSENDFVGPSGRRQPSTASMHQLTKP